MRNETCNYSMTNDTAVSIAGEIIITIGINRTVVIARTRVAFLESVREHSGSRAMFLDCEIIRKQRQEIGTRGRENRKTLSSHLNRDKTPNVPAISLSASST